MYTFGQKRTLLGSQMYAFGQFIHKCGCRYSPNMDRGLLQPRSESKRILQLQSDSKHLLFSSGVTPNAYSSSGVTPNTFVSLVHNSIVLCTSIILRKFPPAILLKTIDEFHDRERGYFGRVEYINK